MEFEEITAFRFNCPLDKIQPLLQNITQIKINLRVFGTRMFDVNPRIVLVYLVPGECDRPQTTGEVSGVESLIIKFIGINPEKFSTFVIKFDVKPGIFGAFSEALKKNGLPHRLEEMAERGHTDENGNYVYDLPDAATARRVLDSIVISNHRQL